MCAKFSSLLKLHENFSEGGSWGPQQYGGYKGTMGTFKCNIANILRNSKEVSKARCLSINEQATSFIKSHVFLCHRHFGNAWKICTLHPIMQHAKFPKNPPGPLFSLRPANGAAFHACGHMLVKTFDSEVSNLFRMQPYLIRVCVTSFAVTLSPVGEIRNGTHVIKVCALQRSMANKTAVVENM